MVSFCAEYGHQEPLNLTRPRKHLVEEISRSRNLFVTAGRVAVIRVSINRESRRSGRKVLERKTDVELDRREHARSRIRSIFRGRLDGRLTLSPTQPHHVRGVVA